MSVKIPQILTGALGAAVYTCMAQRIGNYMLDPRGHDPGMLDALAILAIFAWTTRNLVDDYKAFEHAPDQSFSLGWTMFFSAAAYTLLALAASTLFKHQISAAFLILYFLTLAAWSLASWMRRWRDRSAGEDASSKARRRRRARWMVLHLVCAASIALALWNNLLWPFFVLVPIYAFDCRDCGTFSTKNEQGI